MKSNYEKKNPSLVYNVSYTHVYLVHLISGIRRNVDFRVSLYDRSGATEARTVIINGGQVKHLRLVLVITPFNTIYIHWQSNSQLLTCKRACINVRMCVCGYVRERTFSLAW